MANILSFAEVANIAGVYIKMDTSKEKVINVHIKDVNIIHFKGVEGIFYKNIDDPSLINNPAIFSVNTYSYLSTTKQKTFFTDS